VLDQGLGQPATLGPVEAADLTIGEVARRTGLSVHALRLYEREGLMAGEVRRDERGRRVYSAWDVEWLDNCVKFRTSGMPLATIARLAQLVREGTGNEVRRLELLREHRRHIIAQIEQLRDCLDLIDGKVTSYERHLAAGGTGEPWQQPPRTTTRTPSRAGVHGHLDQPGRDGRWSPVTERAARGTRPFDAGSRGTRRGAGDAEEMEKSTRDHRDP
jgi:DNA-binding transcriptional MerR regulator